MFKRLILVLVLATFGAQLIGQDWEKLNVRVFTLDGSYIYGELISENPREVTLRYMNGDTMVIPHGYITHMKMYKNDRKEFYKKGRYHFTKGGFARLAIGFHGTPDDTGGQSWELMIGKRLNENYSIGAGFGYIGLTASSSFSLHSWFPVYIYGRKYLKKDNSKIYVASKLGYSIPSSRNSRWNWQGDRIRGNYSGALMLNPAIGYHFSSKNGVKFILEIESLIQRAQGNFTLNVQNMEVLINDRTLFWRTGIKFGIEIN